MTLAASLIATAAAFADLPAATDESALESGARIAPSPLAILPFGLLLVAIAVLPLVGRLKHWWESNLHKFVVAASCGIAGIAMIALHDGAGAAGHAALDGMGEFLPFIVLLLSLYVISGGILITGDIRGTPEFNTGLLALGAVMANLLGTTGASMLLIRPLLRANRARPHRAHVVIFFIFTVSNIGGLLLPIGDPPLFLGYLRGVPFEWTLRLFPQWLLAVGLVLVVFHRIDARYARRESDSAATRDPIAEFGDARLRVSGALNVVWLAGVILAAALLVPGRTVSALDATVVTGAREAVMLACAAASIIFTPRALRVQNHFTMTPIVEVAALFSGLFLAMQPALELLTLRGGEMGLHSPMHFFWSTGLLSSVLDNAPTYVVFADVARAVTPADATDVVAFGTGVVDASLLAAVSCGAVFMGALTYIGNGPNLMVAAIAHEERVPMPTFFGYLAWSSAVLIPVFVLVTLVFFRQ